MALDPADLLIFKVREEDAETSIRNKKKPVTQTAPEIKPKVQQSQTIIPKPQQNQSAKQTIIQQPKQNVQQPVQQKQAAPQIPQAQQPQAQKKSLWGNLTSYKPPAEPQEESEPLQERKMMESEPVQQAEAPKEDLSRELLETAIDNRLDEVAALQPKIKIGRQMKNQRESRKLAQRMDCATHPWRKAYALCEYCGRPFCYEDIMEYGNAYYCLDDIDKVSYAIRNSEIIKYNRLSLISSALLAIAFFIFMFYNYQNVITTAFAIQHAGVLSFILNPNLDQVTVLVDFGLMVLSFAAAISIILETQASFKLTTLVGLVTVALFSYQFLVGVNNLYVAEIAACSFLALVTLAYSRVAFDSVPDDGFAAREVELSKSTGY